MSRYSVVIDGSAPPWAQRLQADLDAVFGRIAKDTTVRTIQKANLPTNGSAIIAIVPDEAGGSVLAWFDNGTWRRVTDRAVVS